MSAPSFTSLSTGLQLNSNCCISPRPATQPDAASSCSTSTVSAPLQLPLPFAPSQALVPYTPLAPSPANYVSLPRCYEPEQQVYPYLRSPHHVPLQPNLSQNYTPMPNFSITNAQYLYQPSNNRSSTISTWRADARPQHIPPPPLPQTSFLPLPPSFPALTRRGADFTVYHVCVKCHRPRSIHYHRDHPIYPGAPAPSPSICHRCKRSKDDRHEDEWVEKRTFIRRKESDARIGFRTQASSDEESLHRHRRIKSKYA